MPAPPGLFERHPNRVFVETGTYLGEGVAAALVAGFELVHSVELHPKLHRRAEERFRGDARIRLHAGDSAAVLPRILAGLDEPATFWLDGHHSGEGTARAAVNPPLLAELAAIGGHRVRRHTVLIDDLRCLDGPVFEGLREATLLERIASCFPGHQIRRHDGHVAADVLALTPAPDPRAHTARDEAAG